MLQEIIGFIVLAVLVAVGLYVIITRTKVNIDPPATTNDTHDHWGHDERPRTRKQRPVANNAVTPVVPATPSANSVVEVK
jgi:hypothetical protein